MSIFIWGLVASWWLMARPVQAQTATSESYLLELGELLDEPDSGVAEVDLPVLNLSGVRRLSSAANPTTLSSYGTYLVDESGMYDSFPYATQSGTAIRFAIDALQVDLPLMSPGILGQAQTELLVKTNIPAGYRLYAAQDKTLRLYQNNSRLAETSSLVPHEREQIANTTCDAGDCDYQHAGEWQDQDVAGFGYTITGPDARGDFAQGTKYMAFATLDQGETAQVIAYHDDVLQVLDQRSTVVHYQVGVTPDNEAGTYTNLIQYTLVPNF